MAIGLNSSQCSMKSFKCSKKHEKEVRTTYHGTQKCSENGNFEVIHLDMFRLIQRTKWNCVVYERFDRDLNSFRVHVDCCLSVDMSLGIIWTSYVALRCMWEYKTLEAWYHRSTLTIRFSRYLIHVINRTYQRRLEIISFITWNSSLISITFQYTEVIHFSKQRFFTGSLSRIDKWRDELTTFITLEH